MGVVTSAVTMVASTTDAATVVTSSFTPIRNDLLVLLVGVTGVVRPAAAMTITKSIATAPGFVPVGTAIFNSSVDAVHCFVGAGFEPPTARTITIAFGGTCTGNFWGVYRVSGMSRTGLGAIRQLAVQQNGAAAGTPAPVFAASALVDNPLVGILGNATNPATVTPPANFTETIDTGYATPTSGFEAVFASRGVTASTITWGSTSGSAFGALVVELDTRTVTADDKPMVLGGWGGVQ